MLIPKCVYILGIGGTCLSYIARWFKYNGSHVYGTDDFESVISKQLVQEGIEIQYGTYDCQLPTEVIHDHDTLVIYTVAIDINHPKLLYFNEYGYCIVKRDDIMSEITKEHFTIAIAGSHGKTTTTSLIGHILKNAKFNVSLFAGGSLKNYNSNFVTYGDIAKTNVVIEADEFDYFFLSLFPNVEVITNIDVDHLDIYHDKEHYDAGFIEFSHKVPHDGHVIAHASTYAILKSDFEYYALNSAPIRANNAQVNGHFDYINEYTGDTIKDCVIPIPGYHNIENALAAITVMKHLHMNDEDIRNGLTTFLGVQKRFDIVYNDGRHIVIDDYGHHPTEIKTVINAIRALYRDKTITAIIRPHQYIRTKDFWNEFINNLSLADSVIILDIYQTREKIIEGISAQTLCEQLKITDKASCDMHHLVDALAKIHDNDIIINFGAGDSEIFTKDIINYLSTRCNSN